MKYNLDSRENLVDILLITIIFVPCLIGVLFLIWYTFDLGFSLFLPVKIISYILSTILLFLLSKKKLKQNRHYLEILGNEMHIKYKIASGSTQSIDVTLDQIKEISYYRLISRGMIESFFVSYTISMSVMITYIEESQEKTAHIGYMRCQDIKKIAIDNNIPFKVY